MSTVANKRTGGIPFTFTSAAPSKSPGKWEYEFHLLMTLATFLVVLVSYYGHFCCKLTASFTQMLPTLLLLLFLLAVAAQYRWREAQKCFHVVMMVFWIVVITNFHFFPMYMAARQDVPMSDAWLARMDQMIGIEVPAVMKWLRPYAAFNNFMLTVYGTLIPLMTLATVLPPLLNRMDKAKEYAIACLVAAAIALPAFACFQAVGPWDYYGYDPVIPSLSAKASMLAALKTDAWFQIDVTNRDGLITFPSFHVVLTVLAAVTLWNVRYLRWPATIWATLIVISTVTTGIHYLVDVVGGLAVAFVAYGLAQAYVRWESCRLADSVPGLFDQGQ
jgi:membrane-associated phospholipid phosphatase